MQLRLDNHEKVKATQRVSNGGVKVVGPIDASNDVMEGNAKVVYEGLGLAELCYDESLELVRIDVGWRVLGNGLLVLVADRVHIRRRSRESKSALGIWRRQVGRDVRVLFPGPKRSDLSSLGPTSPSELKGAPIDGSGSLADRGRVPEQASQNVRAQPSTAPQCAGEGHLASSRRTERYRPAPFVRRRLPPPPPPPGGGLLPDPAGSDL